MLYDTSYKHVIVLKVIFQVHLTSEQFLQERFPSKPMRSIHR